MTTIEIFISSSTQVNMMIKIKIKITRATRTETTTRTDSTCNRMTEISTESRVFNKIDTRGTTKDFTRRARIVTGEMKNIKIMCMLTNIIIKLIGRLLIITTTTKEMARSQVTPLRLHIQKINRQISKKSGNKINLISITSMNTILNSLNMERNLMSSLAIMRMIKKIVHMWAKITNRNRRSRWMLPI